MLASARFALGDGYGSWTCSSNHTSSTSVLLWASGSGGAYEWAPLAPEQQGRRQARARHHGHAGAIDARGLGRVVSLLLHGQPPLAKAAVAELTPQLRFGGRLRHQPTAVCALERRNQTLDLIWQNLHINGAYE